MKLIVRVFLIFVILFFGVYLYLYKKYSARTFILYYHKVDYYKGGFKGSSIKPETFDKQMAMFYKKGYRTISLTELVKIIKNKKNFPEKVFVITFDDGYENNYTNAFPVLKKYGFTATIFLNAGAIGKFWKYPRSVQPEQHLSASQIKEMSEYLDFGSHTVNHPDLTKISENEILNELSESKKIIEKISKKTVVTFCYPFGSYNENVVMSVKKIYEGACTTDAGLVSNKSNPYLLPRVELKEFYAMSPGDFFKNIGFYIKIFIKA